MKNNGRGTTELFRYSLKTLRRTLGGFVILFVIGTVGAYLLTTSVLLYKCSGDVIKASSLPYSGYYIVADESSKEDILAGKTVSFFGGWEIYKLLRAHECVEDVVYSADDTIKTNISAISLDGGVYDTFPVTALFSSALEADFRSGKNILTEGRHITRDDVDCVIVSDELAKLNGLSLGDRIELGQRNIKDYRIVGIYRHVSGGGSILTYQDILSNMLYISNEGNYFSQYTHDVLVKFTDNMDSGTVNDFSGYINDFPWGFPEKLYFISVNELNRTSEGGVSVIYDITLTLSILIGATMVFITAVLIYYHVLSRQKEIGMLRTIGERRIAGIFLIDLCFVTLLSSLIGTAAACVTSKGIMSRVFGLINNLLNTSNAYNTNSIKISGAIVKQITIMEYMTAGSYLLCSALSAGIMLLAVCIVTVVLIHRVKKVSPLEVMGRQ